MVMAMTYTRERLLPDLLRRESDQRVHEVDPADGCAAIPQGVGLGTEVNEEFLKSNPARDWIPEAFRADGSPSDW